MLLSYKLLSFFLHFVFDLAGMLCLFRLYMQLAKTSFMTPIEQGVIDLSNWLVMPLQRVIPSIREFDLASFVAAYLCSFVLFALLWTLFYWLAGASMNSAMTTPLQGLLTLLVMALLNVFKLAIYLLSAIIVVLVILSWIQPGTPGYWLAQQLSAPLLTPLRKLIPSVAGLDLTPLIALAVLQALLIIISHLM